MAGTVADKMTATDVVEGAVPVNATANLGRVAHQRHAFLRVLISTSRFRKIFSIDLQYLSRPLYKVGDALARNVSFRPQFEILYAVV